jgi:hypothetical protein
MKACLVDFQQDGLVIPWMTFDSLAACVTARKTACSSWPSLVAEFDDSVIKQIPSRRAELSGRNDPYRHEKVEAFKPIGAIRRYYDIEQGTENV